MECGILDGIQEQKKGFSRKASKIQIKSVVLVSSSVPTLT